MSQLNDAIYYRNRAEHARAAAAAALSPQIRGIHLEMASRYAELLQEAEGGVVVHRPRVVQLVR